MSHEIDTSNSRNNMAYMGQAPWHGLGQPLVAGCSLETWQKAAGLEWDAVVCSLAAGFSGDNIDIPSYRALIRSDTRSVLSIVSKGYKPVQPNEILDFFADLVQGIDAGFTMETAGCLRGGRKIWALAKSNGGFDLSKEDRMEQYLLMATSFDRSLPTVAQMTSVRVVCANTLRIATNNKEGAIRITHNRSFNADKVKAELGFDKWTRFADDCRRFADTQLNDDAYRLFLAECIAESNPHKEASDYLDKNDDDRFNELIDISKMAPGQNLDTANGTLWGALNAVTRWVDHSIQSKSQDNRLDSAWFGRGARVKQFALNRAREMVGV